MCPFTEKSLALLVCGFNVTDSVHSLTQPFSFPSGLSSPGLHLSFLSSWIYQFRNSTYQFRHVCGWSSGLHSNSLTTNSVLFCTEKKKMTWKLYILPSEVFSSKITHLAWLAAQPQGLLNKEHIVPQDAPTTVATVPCFTAALSGHLKVPRVTSGYIFYSVEKY